MMINGFNPSLSFPRAMQQSQSINLQSLPAQQSMWMQTGGMPLNNAPSFGGFQSGGMPSFSMGSFMNPLMSGMSRMGNQLMSGFGNAFSGMGSMMPTAMPSFPSVNWMRPVQQNQPVNSMPAMRQTPQQIFRSMGQGAQQAFQDLGTMAKEHGPAMLALGGAMTGAGAVCSFMCGTMAATGGMMLANHAHSSNPHAM